MTINLKTATPGEMQAIYDEAFNAGMEAGNAHNPTPIMVGEAVGLSSKIDYSKQTYFVPEGVCGFAWVNIKPANSRFARFLLNKKLARTDSYAGGICVWVREFGQSYERKRAFAQAFVKILSAYGVKCYSESRLD